MSANCQPGCSLPIHLSSLPWLVVALSFVAPHPPPPVVFTTRRLILSPLNNPPPPVCKRLPSRWPLVCQLVVVSPLLSRRCRLSSFQHAASASRPLDTQPALQRASSASQHTATSCILAPLLSFASLLMVGSHISSRRAAASSAHPRHPPSFTLAGCCVSSCCAASAYRPLINTAAS